MKKPKGWKGQSGRHRQAAKGIKTGRKKKIKNYGSKPVKYDLVTGKTTSEEAKDLLFEATKLENIKKRKENFGSNPRKIGKKWTGEKYIHGPRLKSPKRYAEFRLGKKTKQGKRLIFGRVKGTQKWEVQSKLTPTNYSFFPRNQGSWANIITNKRQIEKDFIRVSRHVRRNLNLARAEKNILKESIYSSKLSNLERIYGVNTAD